MPLGSKVLPHEIWTLPKYWKEPWELREEYTILSASLRQPQGRRLAHVTSPSFSRPSPPAHLCGFPLVDLSFSLSCLYNPVLVLKDLVRAASTPSQVLRLNPTPFCKLIILTNWYGINLCILKLTPLLIGDINYWISSLKLNSYLFYPSFFSCVFLLCWFFKQVFNSQIGRLAPGAVQMLPLWWSSPLLGRNNCSCVVLWQSSPPYAPSSPLASFIDNLEGVHLSHCVTGSSLCVCLPWSASCLWEERLPFFFASPVLS